MAWLDDYGLIKETVTYIYPCTFLYKNKLHKNNEAEIGKKKHNKLRTFWGREVQNQKIKIAMIYISFKNLNGKEWLEHLQSLLLWYKWMLSRYATLHSSKVTFKYSIFPVYHFREDY